MIERLRSLLDRPFDPAVARAVTLLGLAAGLGFAVVVGLSGVTGGHHAEGPTAGSGSLRERAQAARVPGPSAMPEQDPQDRPGTPAHRRAARELAAHRALQHVPFERGGASIDLVGARGTRALLRVRAASVTAAHRAWKAFLRRYRDDGDAYVPIFEGNRTRRES